jgi:hypothetical protein
VEKLISFLNIKSKKEVPTKKIEITENIYNNNLEFYTILKLLIKCKLSDKQLILLQDILLKNIRISDKVLLQKILLSNNAIATDGTQKYEDLCMLINTLEHSNINMWKDMMDVSIELMLIKDLILQESKSYANNQYKEVINQLNDKLSLEYDMSKLSLPYGQRVISSLLVFALTDNNRKNEFILEASGKTVKSFGEKISKIINNYKINCNNMFSLIMTESVNQSIVSDAGQSYESRVEEKLLPLVDKINGHSHDSKISSVEYDFTFELNNKQCGISAKRTLRERYKQNFEDVELLDVDFMFLITLGIDLNEEKLNNILQKNGIYVVVAQEVYDSKEYLKNNNRVISSENLNKDNLIKLTSMKCLSKEEMESIVG